MMKQIALWLLCIMTSVVYATNPTQYDQQYLKWKENQSSYVKQQNSATSKTVNQVQGKISINQADLKTLQQLHGVGEKKAQAIIEYRQTHGPFKQLSELKNVSGIGEKLFEKNKDILVL
ncbi:ComEA family DNA-binding protein [Acinetobacter rathckeae]|uniref:ComEA family DNA-binding protein n=1 Tax=Acinetobacter rathckeae TaxID=2605272 RepID=UPI0018A319FA|nr:helix-hairpin-helix domain-containing protein [Acinetobacter rathckeae]MBF7696482.1 helix-hairpin-helix domain-containing protein [Acinetobacter rathckeae]